MKKNDYQIWTAEESINAARCKIAHLVNSSKITDTKIFQKCANIFRVLSSRLFDCYGIIYEALNLTSFEIECLIKINLMLQEVQSKIQIKVNELQKEMDKKLSTIQNMFDYEIKIRLFFILKEDDKEFEEDDDNIIAEHTCHVFKKYLETIFSEVNYMLPGQSLSHPLNKIDQCELFHHLYDHIPYMRLKDIIRIGSVWIDIQVYHQFKFELS